MHCPTVVGLKLIPKHFSLKSHECLMVVDWNRKKNEINYLTYNFTLCTLREIFSPFPLHTQFSCLKNENWNENEYENDLIHVKKSYCMKLNKIEYKLLKKKKIHHFELENRQEKDFMENGKSLFVWWKL